LDAPALEPGGWIVVGLGDVELEEEPVAVPVVLLQAARIAAAPSKRKETRILFGDSAVRIHILFILLFVVSALMIGPQSLRFHDALLKKA
jgi:hypothetical protein